MKEDVTDLGWTRSGRVGRSRPCSIDEIDLDHETNEPGAGRSTNTGCSERRRRFVLLRKTPRPEEIDALRVPYTRTRSSGRRGSMRTRFSQSEEGS